MDTVLIVACMMMCEEENQAEHLKNTNRHTGNPLQNRWATSHSWLGR